jgi:hypothetical protein
MKTKISFRSQLIIFLLFFFLTATASAATYYVDATNGNDRNNGLTEINSWKTMAKVNASKFNPGDQILFKKGEVWRETLNPSSSGKPGLPIYFGAYGTGNKPSIRGSNTYNTTNSWVKESGNVWYLASISKEPGILSHNDIVGQRKPQKNVLTTQWDYCYDSANARLYIYSTTNPATMAAKLEVAVRKYAIGPQSSSYIIFDNLDVRHAYSIGWLGWGATNIIFQNCSFNQSGGDHLLFHNGSNFGMVINCTFDDWGVNNGQYYAVHTQGYGATPTGPVDIEKCTFTTSTTILSTEHSVIMQDLNSWIRNVRGNTIEGNGGRISHDGIVFWKSCSATTYHLIEHNTIQNIGGIAIAIQQLEAYGAHPTVTVRYNRINNVSLLDSPDKSAIRLRDFSSASSVSVYYNIINKTQKGVNGHTGIDLSAARSVIIYNNTIFGVDTGISVRNGSIGTLGMNNIVYNNRVYGILVDGTSAINADYNCISSNVSGNYSGIIAGTHDILLDPLFKAAAAGNFHLAPNSPCKDKGIFVGLTQDIDDRPVPLGMGTDIGAIEEANILLLPQQIFRYYSLYEKTC